MVRAERTQHRVGRSSACSRGGGRSRRLKISARGSRADLHPEGAGAARRRRGRRGGATRVEPQRALSAAAALWASKGRRMAGTRVRSAAQPSIEQSVLLLALLAGLPCRRSSARLIWTEPTPSRSAGRVTAVIVCVWIGAAAGARQSSRACSSSRRTCSARCAKGTTRSAA